MHTYIYVCMYVCIVVDATIVRAVLSVVGSSVRVAGRTDGRTSRKPQNKHTTHTHHHHHHRYYTQIYIEPETDGWNHEQLKWSSMCRHRPISSTCNTCALLSGIKIHLLRSCINVFFIIFSHTLSAKDTRFPPRKFLKLGCLS